MADEQNKDVEKLLRAYAEARRKGANLPLHPATRKILHAEAARQFKNDDRKPLWSRLRAFWPQLAFGSGLCAIFVVAVISLRHQSQKEARLERQATTQAAASDTELRSESVNETLKKQLPDEKFAPKGEAMDRRDLAFAPAPAAAAPPDMTPQALPTTAPQLQSTAREEEQLVKAKDETTLVEQQLKTAAPSSTRARASISRILQSQDGAPGQQAPKETPVATYNYARANRLTNLGDALRLQFVSVAERGQQPTPQLLNSFQLEQQGDDVRITDKDGSIYLGQLFPEPPGQPTNAANLAAVTDRGLGVTENIPGTSVQMLYAQGTNRTLAKPVRLEGRYLERTNPIDVTTPTSASSVAASSAARLGRARYSVVGKAVVGQTNEVPLNAVSLEPK